MDFDPIFTYHLQTQTAPSTPSIASIGSPVVFNDSVVQVQDPNQSDIASTCSPIPQECDNYIDVQGNAQSSDSDRTMPALSPASTHSIATASSTGSPVAFNDSAVEPLRKICRSMSALPPAHSNPYPTSLTPMGAESELIKRASTDIGAFKELRRLESMRSDVRRRIRLPHKSYCILNTFFRNNISPYPVRRALLDNEEDNLLKKLGLEDNKANKK